MNLVYLELYCVVDRHKQDGARSAVAADSQSDPPGFCHGHLQTSSDARQDNASLIEKVSLFSCCSLLLMII